MDQKITINGAEYVPAGSMSAANTEGLRYCMVRSETAGVFCGWLKKREGREITLLNARRIWYWEGAATLSQLAMQGTSEPLKCRFPCEVSEILILEAVEVIPMTEAARQSIAGVPVWEA